MPGYFRPVTRRPRPDWWLYFVALLLALQLSSFLIAQMRPGLMGAVLWAIASDRVLWLGLGMIFLVVAIAFSLCRRPFCNHWRALGLGSIVGLVVSTVTCRVFTTFDD